MRLKSETTIDLLCFHRQRPRVSTLKRRARLISLFLPATWMGSKATGHLARCSQQVSCSDGPLKTSWPAGFHALVVLVCFPANGRAGIRLQRLDSSRLTEVKVNWLKPDSDWESLGCYWSGWGCTWGRVGGGVCVVVWCDSPLQYKVLLLYCCFIACYKLRLLVLPWSAPPVGPASPQLCLLTPSRGRSTIVFCAEKTPNRNKKEEEERRGQ